MNKNTNVSFWTYSDCNDIGTGSVGASFKEKRSDHVFFTGEWKKVLCFQMRVTACVFSYCCWPRAVVFNVQLCTQCSVANVFCIRRCDGVC